MASVNKVILIGNLGADPEMRSTANGVAVCNLRLATTDTWRDKASGEKREATEWHRVVLFNRLAEIAGQYLRKGSPLYVEGRLRTRKWTDNAGVERTTTEIEASDMTLLGNRPAEKPVPAPAPKPGAPAVARPAPEAAPAWLEDDIPF